MQEVAKINGVCVYSDKQVVSIHNTRITFADGSSCDVSDGTVDNRGPGSIRIGGDRKKQEKVTKGPTRHSTDALRVSKLAATLVIEVWDGAPTAPQGSSHPYRIAPSSHLSSGGMEITLSGPKDQLEAIITRTEGATLVIEGKDLGHSSGDISISNISVQGGGQSSVFIGGSIIGGVSINGGNITVGGNTHASSEDAVTVTVKVPRGTPIVLEGVKHAVNIGDVDGKLAVKASGCAKIVAGRMQDANLTVSGSSETYIAAVNGTLMVQASGSALMEVNAGTVPNLNVQASGSASVTFKGTADSAMLSGSGSASVQVSHVKNHPMISRSGVASVTVDR